MSRADIIRPDSKGRVTLGALARGVSSYHVTINKDNSLLLEPYVEIPAKERWVFENKDALKKLEKGLKDTKTFDLGDFTKYVK